MIDPFDPLSTMFWHNEFSQIGGVIEKTMIEVWFNVVFFVGKERSILNHQNNLNPVEVIIRTSTHFIHNIGIPKVQLILMLFIFW